MQSTAAGDAGPLNIVDFLPRQTPNPALPTVLNNPALGEPYCHASTMRTARHTVQSIPEKHSVQKEP